MNDVENCVLKLMSLSEKDRAKVMQVMDLLGVYEAPRIQECLAELAGMSFPEPGKAYDLVKKILVEAPEFPKDCFSAGRLAAEKPQTKPEQEFVSGTRYILDKFYKCVLVRNVGDGVIVRCTNKDSTGEEILVRSLSRLELDHF